MHKEENGHGRQIRAQRMVEEPDKVDFSESAGSNGIEPRAGSVET